MSFSALNGSGFTKPVESYPLISAKSQIIDELPDRAKFESVFPDHKVKVEEGSGPDFGGTVKWFDIDLDPHQVRYFEVRVHVVGPPDRTIINKACLFDGHDKLDCDIFKSRVEQGSEEAPPAPGTPPTA